MIILTKQERRTLRIARESSSPLDKMKIRFGLCVLCAVLIALLYLLVRDLNALRELVRVHGLSLQDVLAFDWLVPKLKNADEFVIFAMTLKLYGVATVAAVTAMALLFVSAAQAKRQNALIERLASELEQARLLDNGGGNALGSA